MQAVEKLICYGPKEYLLSRKKKSPIITKQTNLLLRLCVHTVIDDNLDYDINFVLYFVLDSLL